MANTSLAEQLRKLATPHTKLLSQKKKQPSLLFDPSEAAAIDRVTYFEIGVSGLNDLIEINDVFEEFRSSLFDETSKNFERAVETFDVNSKLNAVIKRFLYLLSPYFLLKPAQRTLEWLIARFHIHDYNTDELICMALPYHGTRLFARLIQIFDLKNSHEKWQWLYPLQKKGIPLSKVALFNHCATDVSFLKLICEFTVDAVKVHDRNAFKLATLYGFYSTTIVGALQHATDVTELHLTYMLPSLMLGLSSSCIDYTASAFIIIATALTKISFQERLCRKLAEKITEVKHTSLQNSAVLLMNILYQTQDLDSVTVSSRTLKNILEHSSWFVPTLGKLISSGIFPNIFYLAVVRDTLQSLRCEEQDTTELLNFVHSLLETCRVDDSCAEKLIKIIIEESKQTSSEWGCELVQKLERQYPSVWDGVVSTLLRNSPSESLSRALGLTSITSQVQCFEKLNHPVPSIRVEAIRYIAENPDSVKIKYIESSLMARWEDEDPSVVEAMFLLPEKLRCFSEEICQKLLLKCFLRSDIEWCSLLLKVIDFLKTSDNLGSHATTYTILLFPFLLFSSDHMASVRSSVLEIDLPFLRAIKKNLIHSVPCAMSEALKDVASLPTADDLVAAYDQLPESNVCVLSLLLLLSAVYGGSTCSQKSEILSLVFNRIFPNYFRKLKWKPNLTSWSNDSLESYYARACGGRKLPTEIAHKFFESVLEYTPLPEQLSCSGWWDLLEDHSTLIATLYMYLNQCSSFCEDTGCNLLVSTFIKEHFKGLPAQINFLCNMCLVHRDNTALVKSAFGMMDLLLKNSDESYAWTLSLSQDNIIVPCILIFLYSDHTELRAAVIQTVELLCMSIGLAISNEVTYVELLKHVLQYKDEIVLDREQLPSVVYTFLSQDADVQALLPVSVRCFTKNVFETLFDCIISEHTPLLVSASLLPVVDFLQDAVTIRKLIVLARRVLASTDYPNESGSSIVLNIIDKFNIKEVGEFERDDLRSFLEYCMENCSKIKIRAENGVTCLGAVVLRKMSTDLFDNLKPNLQKYLLGVVLNICATGDNIELVSVANSFIKKITLNCELVVSYLETMKNMGSVGGASNNSENDSKKLKRRSTVMSPKDTTMAWSQTEWNTGIALLELIQNKKKLENCRVLLPLLFDVLQKCCEMDDKMPMEYAKQVCLSCILNCSQKLAADSREAEKLQRLFSVELVVNCIRMSPNPQTHHHALLLLAHCATFAPDQVLHNIMAIFTFMGSSVLRQDDAFSFQIISNILKTIVPLLVRKKDDCDNEDGSDDQFSVTAIRDVLKVFAVSIPDIPDHRRIPLLLNLMNVLDQGKYVHIFTVLALQCAAKTSITNKTVAAKYGEVVLELLLLLPLPRVLASFQKMLAYTNTLPHNVDDNPKKLPVDEELLDIQEFTNKELHHFKYTLLNFISTALSKNEFIHRVSVVDQAELKSLEVYFRGIIEEVLMYVKSVTEYNSVSRNTTARYWKVMMSQALEILNKTNALLTIETFLTVIRDLICHNCLTVQRKSIELLNWRLQQTKDKDEFAVDDLASLTTSLMKIVSTISKNSVDDSNDLKLNQQTALICLKLLAKYYYSADHANRFRKVLAKLCVLLQKYSDTNEHVLACLVLCIAELVVSLKVHSIEALPKFMPQLLRLLERYKKEEISRNDVTLLSIVTALQKIVETLPNFLSPYLESILFEITCITACILLTDSQRQSKTDDEVKQANIFHKLKLIRQKMSEIPSRVLLPSVSSCFTRLCESRNFHPIKPLVDILAESFPKGGQFSPELTRLFLTMFDFRCIAGDVDEEQISLVESYIIDALCNIVLKCSETTFRPFYHKLYDWGVIASKEQSKKDRIITYYRILCHVSEKLKSIFVLFASNFIRNAAEMLDKNNLARREEQSSGACILENKAVLLVDSILKTLYNVFKYDTIKFLTKDRFNMLVEPLVNQIENTIGDYETRSAEIIVPTVARFAAATSDDSLWKQFNYLILLKTRHSLPQIRLAALDVVCTFATHLGDNFLPFLPETVPFLAELLEDENEHVEKQTHKAVQRLEQILEEPIQKYF